MTALSVKAVLKDRRGVVGIYLTAALTAMVMLMVGALDLMRVSIIRARAQSALDLSVLAAGRNLAAGEARWSADAQAYFRANFGESGLGATIDGPTVTPRLSAAGGTEVQLDATVTVPLMISAFTDTGSMTFTLSTVARQQSVANLEMALAIDVTGSMASAGKMAAAQEAARVAIDAVLGENGGGNSFVGLVPFNETVNLGNTAITRAWLDTTTPPQPTFTITSQWRGCMMERPLGEGGAFVLDDTPPGEGSRFRPYGASRASKNGWGQWNATAYVPKNDGYTQQQEGCPSAPASFLGADAAALKTSVNNMQASGSTMIAAGLVWSWRMLSPAWRGDAGWDDAALPQDFSPALNKVVVLLTDGDNAIWMGRSGSNYYFLSPFGNAANTPVWGNLVGQNNEQADDLVWDEGAAAAASLCERMKARGIIIFTIPFGSSDNISANTETLLRGCASDSTKYLRAHDNEGLRDAFNTVINTLSQLTIIQ